MRKLLALPALALMTLVGCANLGQMTGEEFEATKNRAKVATTIVSSRIAQGLDDEMRQAAHRFVTGAKEAIEGGNFESLNVNDLLGSLVESYGEELGLSEQNKRDIRDAALIIELFTGPIQVNLNGELDPRDQEMIMAFLDGLEEGLKDL